MTPAAHGRKLEAVMKPSQEAPEHVEVFVVSNRFGSDPDIWEGYVYEQRVAEIETVRVEGGGTLQLPLISRRRHDFTIAADTPIAVKGETGVVLATIQCHRN